ncbi:MAG: hypothetical protein P0S93_05455 [Candidatus Neptunochlamydia sp.]|nr:hypothetical protein [Candidatus Neptunochlamydia sp.]
MHDETYHGFWPLREISKGTQELGETRTAMGWHVMNSLEKIINKEVSQKQLAADLGIGKSTLAKLDWSL